MFIIKDIFPHKDNCTEVSLEDEGVRTADTLTSIREAARGGLQGLDLEEESDTFNKEPAITLNTIPVRNKR